MPALEAVLATLSFALPNGTTLLELSTVILLAEDEHLIGLVLQEALEYGGYVVRYVASGREALEALEEDDPKVCGVITDIRLGQGPDGWAVAQRAREINPTVPIIYMSGDSALDHPSKGVPESVMLQKPFATAQLVTAISSLLNEAGNHPQ